MIICQLRTEMKLSTTERKHTTESVAQFCRMPTKLRTSHSLTGYLSIHYRILMTVPPVDEITIKWFNNAVQNVTERLA